MRYLVAKDTAGQIEQGHVERKIILTSGGIKGR